VAELKVVKGYAFDDVLLIPKVSDIASRSLIDTSVDLGKGVLLDIPIVSANMKHVTGPKLARTIARLGGLALLHRFDNIETLIFNFNDATDYANKYVNNIGVSVGISEESIDLAKRFIDIGAKILCVDVAHGHHSRVAQAIEKIRKYSDVLLIAGNVATRTGADFLFACGADVIKSGIGNGSTCSTRIETGNGVPQLTALSNIFQENSYKVIADGGIRKGSDVVKSLCFSHCVMLGNLLAGTNESPGEVARGADGKLYKNYAGSSTHKTTHVEGVVGLVPYLGEAGKVIDRLMQGVRSGMSYQGASNLAELRKNPEFVSVSNAGLIESHPHDILLQA
jgi:IMP dehydrogenase